MEEFLLMLLVFLIGHRVAVAVVSVSIFVALLLLGRYKVRRKKAVEKKNYELVVMRSKFPLDGTASIFN